jgi:glycosyltransferase involved in cell wall biosynthesis
VAAAVVVPVFNRLELLRATVASLQAQTLATAEFILVDDRSDEAVWRYLQNLPTQDPRFRILRKPDAVPRGCQVSKTLALEGCRAEGVVFLDSDDLLAPTCLEERYGVLAAHQEAELVVGRQAMFTDGAASLRWVNVPQPGIPDLDRFLDLAYPVDVPWVNGGAMIRTARLHASGIRYRPEFCWEDVAFHFECLVAGFEVVRTDTSGPPDAYYRVHSGGNAGTMGAALHTPAGIRNAATMLRWMRQRLVKADRWLEPRRKALARTYYHACVLSSIDAGEHRLAGELLAGAAEGGLLEHGELRRLRIYRIGRRCLRGARRATYYWNRLARRILVNDFYQSRPWTYGNIAPSSPEAKAALETLLRNTASVWSPAA